MRIGVVARPHYLLGDQAATYLVSSLDNCYFEPGLGQIGCGHQAIWAGAYYDSIPRAFTRKFVEYSANQQWLFMFG